MSLGKQRASQYQPKGAWITKHRRLAIYIRDRFFCQYCGTDLKGAAPDQITLDHLVARQEWAGLSDADKDRLGFTSANDSKNLVTACRSCNSRRGNKQWQDYATGGAIDRITYTVQLPLNLNLARSLIEGGGTNDYLEELR